MGDNSRFYFNRAHRIELTSKIALLGLAFAALASPAFAEENPARIPNRGYNWNGFYGGANLGHGWSYTDGDPGCIGRFGVFNGPYCQIVPAGAAHVSSSGSMGGGQFGFNQQVGKYVWGLETDFQATDINGSNTVNGPFAFVNGGLALPAGSYTASQRLDWFGTSRVRFGYAGFERILIYATGGLAYGRSNNSSNLTAINANLTFPGSASVTKAGWVAGGGIEYAVANNWTAKIEAIYFDLGHVTFLGPGFPPGHFLPLGFTRTNDFSLQYSTVRIGLNYKFASKPWSNGP